MKFPLWVVFVWLCSGTLLLGCGRSTEGMATWSPEDHGKLQNVAEDQGDTSQASDLNAEQKAAQVLWMMRCAGCHGEQGRGDGAQKPPGAVVRDLSDPAWQAERSDEQIMEVIRKGRGMMPAFGEQLGEAGLQSLLETVRGFKR